MFLDKFRRVTRDGRWIPEVDGLRFLAIASVVFFHLAGQLGVRTGTPLAVEPRYYLLHQALYNGDRGVGLFFVISGMILAMPFARHALRAGREVSLRKYYMRRVTRLEPPYILAMGLLIALVLVYKHGHLEPGFAPRALASIFYLHTLIYRTMSPVNPVTWSLEVEIQFYVVAPLIMLLFRIPGKTLRRAVIAGSVLAIGLAQYALRSTLNPLYFTSHAQYFIIGLLVADVFVLDLDRWKSSWWWDLAAVGALLAMFGSARETWGPQILLPYGFALLCLAAMRAHAFRRFLSLPAVAVIGGMCYTIYLLHFALLAMVFKVSHRLILPQLDYLGNFLLQAVLVCIPILAVCSVFFVLVERPCMDPDWPGELWHRLTGRPAQDAGLLDTAGIAAAGDDPPAAAPAGSTPAAGA